jgi:hypothetical protein
MLVAQDWTLVDDGQQRKRHAKMCRQQKQTMSA